MGKLDKMTAGEILQTAESLVTGDRADQHGDMRENHRNMARMVGAYLGTPISEEQMAGIMVCIKLARTKAGSTNPDDFVDMAGYAGIMGHLAGCTDSSERMGETPKEAQERAERQLAALHKIFPLNENEGSLDERLKTYACIMEFLRVPDFEDKFNEAYYGAEKCS